MTFRALLVTKDNEAAEVLAPVLYNFGLRVQCCGYSDAVSLVTEQRFQAILVDFDDPHSAALVLHNIASLAENHPITVALLSDQSRVRKVLSAGASFILYKPISAEQAKTTLRAATALIKSERRSSFRVPIQVAVKLRLKSGDHPAEIEGILLDLSDGGMDVLAAEPLYQAVSVHARFTLPNSPSEFEIMGEVAWANPNGESGVRFVDTPDSVRSALRLWLRENSQTPAAADPQPVDDCKLTDLSLGGCYMETASPFPERAQIALTLRAGGAELQAHGVVRVMHPSRGMGIQLAMYTSAQRAQTETFIRFLIDHPGIELQSLVLPQAFEAAADSDNTRDTSEDLLLNLLRNHEALSQDEFFEALRKQRKSEFVEK